jgi:hypothetical protein
VAAVQAPVASSRLKTCAVPPRSQFAAISSDTGWDNGLPLPSVANRTSSSADTAAARNSPGDISLLKPGVAVFVIALEHEDGKLTSARLYAEKDGIKPPM